MSTSFLHFLLFFAQLFDSFELIHDPFIVLATMGQGAPAAILYPVDIPVVSSAGFAQALERAEAEQAVELLRLHGMARIVFALPVIEKSVILTHSGSSLSPGDSTSSGSPSKKGSRNPRHAAQRGELPLPQKVKKPQK